MKGYLMRIILLFSLISFFNGCGQPAPKKEKEYVYKPVPSLKLRPYIEPYKILDISKLDEHYYRVNKKELKTASTQSQQRIYDINFYIRQITDFNNKYPTKDK